MNCACVVRACVRSRVYVRPRGRVWTFGRQRRYTRRCTQELPRHLVASFHSICGCSVGDCCVFALSLFAAGVGVHRALITECGCHCVLLFLPPPSSVPPSVRPPSSSLLPLPPLLLCHHYLQLPAAAPPTAPPPGPRPRRRWPWTHAAASAWVRSQRRVGLRRCAASNDAPAPAVRWRRCCS